MASPPSIPPPLTQPPHELITTPHPLRNILPHIGLPFHCSPIPQHSMLSLIQPAPTQSLHPPQTSTLAPQRHYPTLPRIVIQPQSHTPHLNTQDGYQRTTQMGTTANDHNIFLWEVMHNVQQQLNNMMAVMSPTPASWGEPTYSVLNNHL